MYRLYVSLDATVMNPFWSGFPFVSQDNISDFISGCIYKVFFLGDFVDFDWDILGLGSNHLRHFGNSQNVK